MYCILCSHLTFFELANLPFYLIFLCLFDDDSKLQHIVHSFLVYTFSLLLYFFRRRIIIKNGNSIIFTETHIAFSNE